MNVSLSLVLAGTDEAPRWATTVAYSAYSSRHCCEEGHQFPEAAASHGAMLAAAHLTTYARSLTPPALGALALAVA